MVLFKWWISLSISCVFVWLLYSYFTEGMYAVFGNLIFVFLPWSSVHPLLSVRGSSPLWIALKVIKLCWPGKYTWFNAYCMWWPATQRISSRPIEKWLISGNGSLHLNSTRTTFLNVLMKIKTAKCSVADFDYEKICGSRRKPIEYIKTSLINNILKHFCSLVFSCFMLQWYAYI